MDKYVINISPLLIDFSSQVSRVLDCFVAACRKKRLSVPVLPTDNTAIVGAIGKKGNM